MAKESIVGPGGGDVIRLGPATVRIIEDGSTTGHRLGIGEITVAPRSAGPPQHRHARHDEGFYVVSGTARFTIGAETYDAPAGTLAMIPPGAPHTFANPGDEPLVMVNTFTPDLYVQYFRDLRQHGRRRRGADARGDRAGHEPVRHRSGRRLRGRVGEPHVCTHHTGDHAVRRRSGHCHRERRRGRPVLLLHGGAGPIRSPASATRSPGGSRSGC